MEQKLPDSPNKSASRLMQWDRLICDKRFGLGVAFGVI